MAKTIIGKKIGMTQIFTEEGVMIPVSVIEAKPNKVVQIKTKETDGYRAVQLGYIDMKERRANKPTKGHFKRWDSPPKKYLAEVRLEEGEEYAAGQEVNVTNFEEGRKIDVTGKSKGKGTQGNIKRHGHHRGPMSHGTKHKRLPGALAAGTYPSRVFKGNDGPGRMGHETVTVQNLDIVKIIPERNILLIKGAVPGPRGSIVRIRYAVKAGYPDDVRLAAVEEYVEEVAAEEPEIVEEAVVEEPAAEEPATEEPAVEEPATEEPAVEEPATEEPAAEEPAAAEEPPAEETAAEEPADVIASESEAIQEAAEEPAVEEVAAEEPAAEEPADGIASESEAIQEAAEESVAEEVTTEEPAVEEPAAEESAVEEPAEEEPVAEEPAPEEDENKGGTE